MKSLGLLLTGALLMTGAQAAGAAGITESFDSRANYASGTAVWNQALGKVHPTLRTTDYDIFGPMPAIDFDIGDGSDGVFDSTTYANFSVAGDVSGNIIRLDTDVHQSLQVTRFRLEAGWKIVAQGTHPLIIKSLSDVQILGEIHCEGADGGDSAGAAIGTGGIGRCGGKNGGDGGLAAQPGADGTDADALVTGGSGGIYFGGTSAGGGGGGSWNSITPTAGPNSGAGNGGQAGASHSDAEFTIVKGGAGGGGGPGDAASAGGGGGGGGGVVLIYAAGKVELGNSPSSTTGFIYAHGGKGGDASGGGGPGGGGGGGSVQIFTGGELNIYNTDAGGASQATGGTSGTNAALETGAIGGLGRSWIATPTFFTGGTGFYNPTEEAPASVGRTEYNPTAQNVVSKSIDRGSNPRPVEALTLSPASANFSFEVAGSNDDFASDDTGFTTDPTLVAGKRWIKIRLQITGTDLSAPMAIEAAAIAYAFVEQDEFSFKAAGCGRVDGGASGPGASLLLLTPLILLILRFKNHNQAKLGRKMYSPARPT